ncbi:MAG TPA: hypothetical protein GX731_08775 [Clostridiales bacterium]|nr:hypothetical protein [Clostridiales bacterium]
MKNKKIVALGTLIFMLLTPIISHTPHAAGDVKSIEETKDNLANISNEEKEVLEELFFITQRIEVMELEEKKISEEIDDLQIEINDTQNRIVDMEKDYDEQLGILEEFLVLYQKGGSTSYLEIVLNSKSLKDLLKTINIFRDISRNFGELLNTIDERKNTLEEVKVHLDERIQSLEQKKMELQEPIRKQKELKKEQEDYLASLKVDREYYEEQIRGLETLWDANKELFTQIVSELNRIAGEGIFTADDLNIRLSFLTVKGSLSDDRFNEILNDNANLTDILFSFGPDKIGMEVPDNRLILIGNFVLVDDNILEFVPEEGTFYGMKLEDSSLEELFLNEKLLIDFKELAGDSVIIDFKLKKVEVGDGTLNFDITPIF